MSSTSNCFGGMCLDLNDVFNFITKIKDLDLYGYARAGTCCADGNTIGPNCTCDDSQFINGIKREDACIFSYCFSWNELFAKMGDVKTAYDNKELVPLLVAVLGGLLTWLGYQGESVFAAHLPTFWKSSGSLLAVTSGIFAAAYAGNTTVAVAVKSEYWKASGSIAPYKGANFLSYGGQGWLSGTLGAFEMSWVVAYLLLCMEIVIFPFVIATEMDKSYAAKYASLSAAQDKAQMDWLGLGFSFLSAFGSWTSAVALAESGKTLINFYDIQDTNGAAVYKAAFGNDPSWDNSIALLVDLLNHTMTVGFYYTLAAVISNCAYFFAYNSLTEANAKNN